MKKLLMGAGLVVLSQAAVAGVELKYFSSTELKGGVFDDSRTEQLTESSETGDTRAKDLIFHRSDDECLETGVYETGKNRYTVNEPYPYDELMTFISGGVVLTPTDGEPVTVGAGDTVLMPKGWTGVWDSEGYRKIYLIYNCPDS